MQSNIEASMNKGQNLEHLKYGLLAPGLFKRRHTKSLYEDRTMSIAEESLKAPIADVRMIE